jgi:hypothetical protein
VQKLNILLTIVLVFIGALGFGGLSHLELGVANYQPIPGANKNRYRVLEQTLADLIEEYGSAGTIYLNDIDYKGLEDAARHAKNWLLDSGYSEIKIISLPGDYTEINLPQVKTAHLKNPGYTQLGIGPKHGPFAAYIIQRLEKIARLSESGLMIVSYYYQTNAPYIYNIPKYIQNSVFVETDRISPYYYYTTNGSDPMVVYDNNLPTYAPKTFYLKSIYMCQDILM